MDRYAYSPMIILVGASGYGEGDQWGIIWLSYLLTWAVDCLHSVALLFFKL